MRVLHIITGMTYGGAQKFLVSLVREHTKSNIEIGVVGLYPGPLGKLLTEHGISYFECNFRKKINPLIFVELIKIMKQWNPDIVHTHLGTADFYGRIAARIFGAKRVISTIHNEEDWKVSIFYRKLDDFSLLFTNSIVACSKSVYRSLNPNIKHRYAVNLIENGIDTHIEAKRTKSDIFAELKIGLDHRLVVCIGRLEEQKNQQLLLNAISKMKAPKFKVCFIGSGSKEISLKEITHQLGVNHNVIWISQTDDPYSYIAASDAIVLPSLWEGLPIVLLESMALKRLVIVSDIDPHQNLINDGHDGLLFKSGDADSLRSTIEHALKMDRMSLNEIQNNASQTIVSHYDIRKVAYKYLEIYNYEK